MATKSDEPTNFLRPKRMPSINRPDAGYFENSDTDEDNEMTVRDDCSRTSYVVEDRENKTSQLPIVQLSQRGRSKAGYLYKQGGKNNDQGWKKRWMVFDGEMLRYFSNNKTSTSLRIIPVSEMENVEAVADGRPSSRSSTSNSSRQFQFKVICKNRTFLFGTDDPDNRINWSSLIMADILKCQKSVTEPRATEIAELTGCARFNGKKNRYYMALKSGKLYYYYNKQDFEFNFPVHMLNMETTNVQEIEGKLQLKSPPDQVFILTFDNTEDTQRWRIALEKTIARVLGDDEILYRVRAVPGNDVCADCGVEEPEWASINFGIILCDICAGIHRGLGVDISKIRSLRMDKIFTERDSLVKLFEKIGNKNANKFWCKELQDCDGINSDSSVQTKTKHIHKKYTQKAFCDHQYFADSAKDLNGALFKAVMTSNLLLTMKILMSGADIYTTLGQDSDLTAYDLAKESDNKEIAEYLYQNGGDIKKQVLKQNGQHMVPKNEPAYLDGYLEKTGPNLKGFNKRKCILEDGKLKYFKDNTLKGTIYMTGIRDICIAEPSMKRLYCFDIICNCVGGTRTYRFSAADEYTRDTWIGYIRRAMPQWQSNK